MLRNPVAISLGMGWRLKSESGGGMNRNRVATCVGICIQEEYRGKGIASLMLQDLLSRSYPNPLRYLETTVSPSNHSSKALFSSLAESLDAPLVQSVLFSSDDFGGQSHEEEVLFRIGPFNLLSKEEI